MSAAVVPKHRPYGEMVIEAISSLNGGRRKGSSRQAILKYVVANNDVNADRAKSQVNVALKKAVKKNAIEQLKGTGASGSFRNVAEEKKPKVKKPVVKKPVVKKPVVKKPVVKKSKDAKAKAKKAVSKTKKVTKSPNKVAAKKTPKKTKSAKKPAAKKPAAKKVKKPSAKKATKAAK